MVVDVCADVVYFLESLFQLQELEVLLDLSVEEVVSHGGLGLERLVR